jgi:hypothetical protein
MPLACPGVCLYPQRRQAIGCVSVWVTCAAGCVAALCCGLLHLLCTSTALIAAVAACQSCNKLLRGSTVLLLFAVWGIMTVQLLTGVVTGLPAGDLGGLGVYVVCHMGCCRAQGSAGSCL